MGINESLDRITPTSSSISNTENLMPGIHNASDGGAELQSGDAAGNPEISNSRKPLSYLGKRDRRRTVLLEPRACIMWREPVW